MKQQTQPRSRLRSLAMAALISSIQSTPAAAAAAAAAASPPSSSSSPPPSSSSSKIVASCHRSNRRFGFWKSSSLSASLRFRSNSSSSFSSSSISSRPFIVRAQGDFPLVGNVAPDFQAEAVFDQEFINVKLSDYRGKKYVVLFFYPLDFTFVCPTEITAFSDQYAEFEKLNTEVIGISIDSVFSHLAWIQTDRKSGGLGDLKYPLVADLTKSISKSYNVLIPGQGVALRGLFILDKEGIIQHATINTLAIGRSVEETLRTLQAVQFVQENPNEVCPAGWKPGDRTMKPDTKLSKEYFAAI